MANIIEIESLDMPEVAAYAHLTEAQLRNRLEPEKGLFIAESPKVIQSALNAGYEPVSMLTTRKHIAGQAKALIESLGDLPVYTADDDQLENLTGYALTRGVLCAMRRPKPVPFESICADAKRVAILEGIVDATNIGAIFRSAAALNIDAILVAPTCCDPLNRRAVRVSMGTVFNVPWTYLADWPHGTTEKLHALGFKTAAMALSPDAVSIEDEALNAEAKLAIVMGAEGDGLAKETIAVCDYTAKIPMAHGVDSLNVAAASAVAFWQLRRR